MELIGKSIIISEIKLELKLMNLKILTEKKESFGHNYRSSKLLLFFKQKNV